MSKNYVGIDFGTTKTLVAYCHEGDEKPEIARLGRSTDKIPTTVFIDEFGETFIGEDADDNMEIDPRRHATNFKLDLGRENSGIRCDVNDASKSYSARILCGEFLKKVHEKIREEVFQGDEVAHVVATIPANFSPAQKEELLQAVHEAGFSSVDLLTEPEAAGLAYTKLESTDKFGKCLIVDWGGGTLDLALLTRNSSGELNVAEGHADGRNDIGGIRLDDALFEFLDEKSNGQISSEDDTGILNLLRRVRVEKEMISKVNHRNIRLPLSSGSWTYPLEREEFNRIIEPLVQKAVSLVQTFLGDIPANLKPEALLLVGGSSSIPYIRETLEKETGIKSYTWQYANEAVAMGAAIAARNDVKLSCEARNMPGQSDIPSKINDSCYEEIRDEYSKKVVEEIIPIDELPDGLPEQIKQSSSTSNQAVDGTGIDVYSDSDLQEGIRLYLRQQYPTAVTHFRTSAEKKNNCIAAVFLSVCFHGGLGCSTDHDLGQYWASKAGLWVAKALPHGNSYGTGAHTVMASTSGLLDGVQLYGQQRYQEAVAYFRTLAGKGDQVATILLSACFHTGLGCKVDHDLAQYWAKKAGMTTTDAFQNAEGKGEQSSSGGAGAGAIIGGIIGTIISPGLGTVIGAGLGGLFGSGADKK